MYSSVGLVVGWYCTKSLMSQFFFHSKAVALRVMYTIWEGCIEMMCASKQYSIMLSCLVPNQICKMQSFDEPFC